MATEKGEILPDVRVQTAEGNEVSISTFTGRVLIVQCLRYYG